MLQPLDGRLRQTRSWSLQFTYMALCNNDRDDHNNRHQQVHVNACVQDSQIFGLKSISIQSSVVGYQSIISKNIRTFSNMQKKQQTNKMMIGHRCAFDVIRMCQTKQQIQTYTRTHTFTLEHKPTKQSF